MSLFRLLGLGEVSEKNRDAGDTESVRRIAAKLERQYIKEYPNSVIAEARVVRGTMEKAMITAFDWMVGKTPWDVKNFTDRVAAETWLHKQLASSGIT